MTDGADDTATDATDATDARFDRPVDVASEVAALGRPLGVVLDCDGVLSPITAHADDSVLLDGVHPVLQRLADAANVAGDPDARFTVAVLSGRSLDGLEQFDLPSGVEVLGSYGTERRGNPDVTLTDDERDRLDRIEAAAHRARDIAGEGAWVEEKPTSRVLHVRQADDERGAEALTELSLLCAEIDGASAHEGSGVLELLVRPSDKGSALRALRSELGAASMVYVGDDVPDEDAFATLGEADLGIKVGGGDTRARRRLSDPDAVREFLRELAERLA